VVHHSLLFTVAYEMLGSAADAEDMLQESCGGPTSTTRRCVSRGRTSSGLSHGKRSTRNHVAYR
jgi:Sigma-70 region 2